MFDKDFKPVLRFAVVSDVHYKDHDSVERERMAKAIQTAYRLADNEDYNKIDALYVVGDFADNGSLTQMQAFKKTLDDNLRPETIWNVCLASHEFFSEGPERAREKLAEVFAQEPNTHRVINGFHFISVSCDHSCRFEDGEKKFSNDCLKDASRDSLEKPVFFFQHPHVTDTVYGSILWGEDDLTPILVNYPQIIDFSGHSHAPINDPRSINQRHFTALGTGTLSYFEGDDYDLCYGTLPPNKEKAAQMLFVEVDADNRVRIYPYDLITDNFFPYVWKIDRPWDVNSYLYTDDRYKTTEVPRFDDDAVINYEVIDSKASVTFGQASFLDERVKGYRVYVKDGAGHIIRNKNIWSEYYFYNMPETLTVEFDDLEAGEYCFEIVAESFWKTLSNNNLKSNFFKI